MKKLIQLFVWLVCSLTVIIAIAGAKRHIKPSPITHQPMLMSIDTKKGMGTSAELPEGPAFKLPKGIVLDRSEIPGYDFGACKCKADNRNCELGAGGLVRLCLALRNQTQEPVTVTLPAGLIFVSLDERTQNGILISNEALVVPAGGTLSFNLALFCLNENRAVTKAKDKYKLGPVSEDGDMRALMVLLQQKDLKNEHNHAVAQEAIWNVTQGLALTAAQHREIASIPGI